MTNEELLEILSAARTGDDRGMEKWCTAFIFTVKKLAKRKSYRGGKLDHEWRHHLIHEGTRFVWEVFNDHLLGKYNMKKRRIEKPFQWMKTALGTVMDHEILSRLTQSDKFKHRARKPSAAQREKNVAEGRDADWCEKQHLTEPRKLPDKRGDYDDGPKLIDLWDSLGKAIQSPLDRKIVDAAIYLAAEAEQRYLVDENDKTGDVALGRNDKAIAEHLGIDRQTVHDHLERMKRRMFGYEERLLTHAEQAELEAERNEGERRAKATLARQVEKCDRHAAADCCETLAV